MNSTDKLGAAKIGPLLLRLAIPSIISMLVTLLYNMVDRIYIGHMEGGTAAMAGLAVTVPLVTLVQAVTMLFGAGGAPLASIRVGEGNKKEAERIMTASFVSLVVSGFMLTLIMECFQTPLLMLFGADEISLPYARLYISIYALGTIFVQIAQGMNPFINCQGFAKFGMMTNLLGAGLNIILDPVFIFVLNMGIAGAALATILSQAVSALWVLYFFFTKSGLRLQKDCLIPQPAVLGSIMALGVSPFVMSFTESLLQISFNNQLSLYGGSMAVASMAILLSLYQIVSLPLSGIAQGAQPILSYNYGAGKLDRVKQTFRLEFLVCISWSILAAGTIILFAPAAASIFSQDLETIAFASWAIRVYLAGGIIFGAQIACQQSFVALGQAKQSLLLALLRKVVLLIPLIYILPALFSQSYLAFICSLPVASLAYNAPATFCVLLAEPVSDVIAACTTTICALYFFKKRMGKKK